MKKKKTIIISIILLAVILVLICLTVAKDKAYKKTDAYRFKQEYEELNKTKSKSYSTYQELNIPKKNPIKYINVKEALSIIKNDSGIIYFGAPWCSWCRNAVPVLLDAAIDKKVDTIYYLNMDKVRNTYEVRNGKLVKTQKEQDGYYELLELLKPVLQQETYKVTDENNKSYDTKELRIYMPFIISVENGKIKETHEDTVKLNDNQTAYDALTKKQYKELYNIYVKLIDSIQTSSSCKVDSKCS